MKYVNINERFCIVYCWTTIGNHKDFSWVITLSSQVHQTLATDSIDSIIQIAVISSHHPEAKIVQKPNPFPSRCKSEFLSLFYGFRNRIFRSVIYIRSCYQSIFKLMLFYHRPSGLSIWSTVIFQNYLISFDYEIYWRKV